MAVRVVEESSPYGLTCSSLEQDVVGDDDGRSSSGLQEGFDVLEEVELFVAGGCPEVGALVVLFFLGNAVLVV